MDNRSDVFVTAAFICCLKTVVDIGFGLRYYLRNFVVRFDTGISEEGLGLYFNFGHVF